MPLKMKFSATRSVEVTNLTTVIMSGLDPITKMDGWNGLVLGQVLLFHGFIFLVVMLIIITLIIPHTVTERYTLEVLLSI